jgi:hypothetical protein
MPHIYDYITKLCKKPAEIIQNYENTNIHSSRQDEARHRKYILTWRRSITRPCKMRGFHGSDCEKRCLLGYKNPVYTSQETCLRYRTQPINVM